MRLVDVESLKLNCNICLSDEDAEILKDALNDMIRNAPTVDAEPVRHGYWVDDYNEYGDFANCNLCGYQIDVHENRGYHNFCPNCGGKMR